MSFDSGSAKSEYADALERAKKLEEVRKIAQYSKEKRQPMKEGRDDFFVDDLAIEYKAINGGGDEGKKKLLADQIVKTLDPMIKKVCARVMAELGSRKNRVDFNDLYQYAHHNLLERLEKFDYEKLKMQEDGKNISQYGLFCGTYYRQLATGLRRYVKYQLRESLILDDPLYNYKDEKGKKRIDGAVYADVLDIGRALDLAKIRPALLQLISSEPITSVLLMMHLGRFDWLHTYQTYIEENIQQCGAYDQRYLEKFKSFLASISNEPGDEMDAHKISEIFGMKTRAVQTRLAIGRTKLKEILDPTEEEKN